MFLIRSTLANFEMKILNREEMVWQDLKETEGPQETPVLLEFPDVLEKKEIEETTDFPDWTVVLVTMDCRELRETLVLQG